MLHLYYIMCTDNIWTPPRNSGGIPPVSTRFSLGMEMSRLTRDGTAEPVSRDQILRRERGQGRIRFPSVQLADYEQDWQPYTRLILTLAKCDDNTYIHKYRWSHTHIYAYIYSSSVAAVVVVDSRIERIVLATEETTVTQQVSHRPIKCQSRLWSQRGMKVNGSHHGDNPLLRPIGIQITTKNYATLQIMAPTNVKTVYQTYLLHIESNLDRLGFLRLR